MENNTTSNNCNLLLDRFGGNCKCGSAVLNSCIDFFLFPCLQLYSYDSFVRRNKLALIAAIITRHSWALQGMLIVGERLAGCWTNLLSFVSVLSKLKEARST